MLTIVHDHIIPAAYRVLPEQMNSPEATAMLLAIGLKESKFVYRTQINGPAMGFWQFESGGINGVLDHPLSRRHIQAAMELLRYGSSAPYLCSIAIRHNDVVAAVFARLLLWTLPDALPTAEEPVKAWEQYLNAWRPGAHLRNWLPGQPFPAMPQKWADSYAQAWRLVSGVE